MKSVFLGLMLASTLLPAMAQSCSAQSPAHTVALVELYTSEGCDSCPPADRFASSFKDSVAPERAVALSMHVDYWDYIGWKDPFAQHLFTERQRWLAQQAHTTAVYTPEFFVGGRELRGWRDLSEAVGRINAKPAQASLQIRIDAPAGGALPVKVAARAGKEAQLFIALYEDGLVSQVKAGENNGVTLRHDRVVRQWLGPFRLAAGQASEIVRPLMLPAGANARRLGVAAFVQGDGGEVLQAFSLPACGG